MPPITKFQQVNESKYSRTLSPMRCVYLCFGGAFLMFFAQMNFKFGDKEQTPSFRINEAIDSEILSCYYIFSYYIEYIVVNPFDHYSGVSYPFRNMFVHLL